MTNRPWVSGGAAEPDPTARQRTVITKDGLQLGVAEYGPPDGTPIIGIHGTPGSRYGGPPPDKPDLYDRLGARVIGFDRPGYGISDRRAGRVAADAAADVAAIADALELETFAVTGGSGGGPHCLAVATLLPEQVTRAACVVGVAPLGVPGLPEAEWIEGMTQGNVNEFMWAMQGEEVLRPQLETQAGEDLARVAVDPANPLDDAYEMSDGDREIMARPEYAVRMQRLMQEAYRNGVDGWVDDDLAFVRSWGFDLSELTVPTMVWYGTDDTLVPPTHGNWLAENVPAAIVVTMDGGHLELVNRAEELLLWLLKGEVPTDAVQTRP
ncbi:MAG TPA: alpha/beta hydrolase [Actinomycetes bacterium]|nr:alpha/beta hydrolase [Actinomycetes bacterium]